MSLSQISGPIAVVDVETTGLFPLRHDRVVEIAAVVIDGNGQISREFVSLVNPARDIGPSSIHGLNSEDILHAPTFGDIASLFMEAVSGAVAIAAHNVRFDKQFLESEFCRIGCPLPACFSICTMQLAGGGRLGDCCSDYGIPLEGRAHDALADARAAARLLAVLLADHPHMTRNLSTLPPVQWPIVSCTGKQPITRDESRRRQSRPPTFLQRLLERRHDAALPLADEGAVIAYGDLLDRVLEDRHVDESEGEALIEMAIRWGLNGNQIKLAHREYLYQLAVVAMADGVVTNAERRDLELVARLLGHGEVDLEAMLLEATSKASDTQPVLPPALAAEASLNGKRVCFTGELQCNYDGQLISREVAADFATKAGLIVMDSVTKKLDLLVLADPHSQSGKAKKARQYGVRIMHEPVFWRAIGVKVE